MDQTDSRAWQRPAKKRPKPAASKPFKVIVEKHADGYVAYPRMNPAEDMVDLMGATRSYQANVAAISAVKDMIQRSIDLLR